MEYAWYINWTVALLLGLAIGIERQFFQHSAGLRTNGLVCFASAVYVSLSILLHDPNPAHVAGQVVAGIGFLGGGVILRDGLTVKGLTTAATLWSSGAIGALAGAGFPMLAAFGTAAILAINLGLHPLSRWIDSLAKQAADVETCYRLRVLCHDQDESRVRALLFNSVNAHPRMVVHGISIQNADKPGQSMIVADIFSTARDDMAMQDLVTRINFEQSVTSASWDRSHSG